MREITVTVNDESHTLAVEPRLLLSDLLRERLELTGTKVGCAMGACGACTVLLDGEPVRSCLTLAVQAHGRCVRTVESLSGGGELHPLQQAFREHHALQCGYCTPGMLMTLIPLLERGVELDAEQAREAIEGNLCRCTGYDTIVAAAMEVSRDG